MRVLHEADMSPSEIRRLHDAEVRRDERKNRDKKKIKLRKAELRQRQESDARKKLHLDWQMILAKKNEELRKQKEAAAAAKSTGGGKAISEKDSDTKATETAVGNAADLVGNIVGNGARKLVGVGVRAVGKRMREKKAARQAMQAGQKKAGERAAETTAAMNQKLLPPGKSPVGQLPPAKSPVGLLEPSYGERARRNPNFKRRQVGLRMPKSPPRTHWSHHPDIPIRPRIDNTQIPSTTPQVSLGRLARNNPEIRRRETIKRDGSVNEEYSCWREEFLYELGELRQKTKNKLDKDPVIDIMPPGKENKITIGPNVTESTKTPQDLFDRRVIAAKLLKEQAKIKMLKYAASQYPKMNEEMNSASHMAKATPRITGHDKSSSDKNKLKQPGKYSAEFVRDEMRKMFAGSRNYKLNSNLANVDADDNDVPNWSQDSSTNSTSASANESFDGHRHHSSGETTNVSNSSSESSARKRRATSAVLKAMAAMNKDVEPKAKKKKKKKTEQ